jgi:hypothetical protein
MGTIAEKTMRRSHPYGDGVELRSGSATSRARTAYSRLGPSLPAYVSFPRS